MRFLLGLLLVSIGVSAQEPAAESKNKGEDIFTEGVKLFMLEDYTKALRQFDTYVKLDEKAAVGFYMKSRAEKQLERNVLAEQSAETSVELDKTNGYYLKNLAFIQKANNNLKASEQSYKSLIKLNPEDREAYFLLLGVQMDAGDNAEALKTLESVEKYFGSDETEKKQTILLRENKVDDALKIGDEKIKVNPEYALGQVKILVQNNRIADAIELLKKTISSSPDSYDAFSRLIELVGVAQDFNTSQELVSQALASKSFPYSVKINAVGSHLKAFGNKAGVLDSLLIETQNLAAKYPNEARSQIYLGDINFRLGNYRDARQAYQKSLKENGNSYESWLAILQTSVYSGFYKDLEKDAERALVYFPSVALVWFYQGLGNVLNENYDDAEIAFEEAARFNPPADLKAAVDAGVLYTAVKAKKKDVAPIQELLKKNPQNEYVQFFNAMLDVNQSTQEWGKLSAAFPMNDDYKIKFAQSLFAQKKTEESRKTLGFVREQSKNVEFFELSGDIAKDLGEIEAAKAAWQKGLELDKSNKSLLNKLK